MPPRKRKGQPSTIGRQTRSKQAQTPELTVTDPPVPQPATNNSGFISLDINALSAAISTTISEAAKTSMSRDSLTETKYC